MKVKEKLHTNRVLRVLRTAVKELEKLNNQARDNDLFPRTTQKAFIEALTLLHRTETRIIARDASVI